MTQGGAGGSMRLCRSRNDARRCTRELGHPGLHRHRTLMWTDAAADALRCGGSGLPGVAAERSAAGFPDGRALCPRCHGFVALQDGRLAEHDAGEGGDTVAAREWLNTHGW